MTPVHLSPAVLMKLAAISGVGVGAGAFFTLFGVGDSLPGRSWRRYRDYVARRLRTLFLPPVAERVVLGQVIALVFVLLLLATVALPYWWVGALLALLGPPYWLERERRRRVEHVAQARSRAG